MTSTTDLHTFLQTRRSIRRFKTDPVPDTVIERIITTATYAPSAHHRQPWRFAVLIDSATKTKLADSMAIEFERDLKVDQIAQEEIVKRVNRSRERILAAPVIVVLNVDLSEMDTYPDEHRNKAEYIMATQSVANAALQLMLAAHAEGLGSVWVCSPLFAQETVQNALDLPKSWEPQGMIFLGYSKDILRPRERKSIEEIVKKF